MGVCQFNTGVNGNFSQDPLFIDAGFLQFRLRASSPAVDAGSNSALQAAGAQLNADISTDLDGNPRVVNATGKTTSIVDMGAYEYQGSGPAVTLALTSSLNPSIYGQAVTFTAQVSTPQGGTGGVPTGSVVFSDGQTALATVPLDGSGRASFTTASLAATNGSTVHDIGATYVPSGNFGPGNATLSQVVQGLASTTGLAVTPLAGQSGDTYTMVATVSNSSGQLGAVPTGRVDFLYGGGGAAQTAPVVNGVATLQATHLLPGANQVTAVYQGDTVFAASTSAPVVVQVTGTTTAIALSASPNPGTGLSPVVISARLTEGGQGAPPGSTILLTVGPGAAVPIATDATGTATYTLRNLLPGMYTVTASFAAAGDLLASSASLTETVVPIATTTTLQVAPNPAYLGQSVALTASVGAGALPVGVGSVAFFDGSASLGVAKLNSAGQAVLSTSALATGTHTLTAVFGASGPYGGSNAAAIQELVLAPGFTIALSPSTITLHAGQRGDVGVSLASVGGFSGALTLGVGAMPTYASGTLSPASVSLASGATASATLALNTAQAQLQGEPARPGTRGWAVALAGLLLVPTIGRRRRSLGRWLVILFAVLASSGLVGCGTVGDPFHLAPNGTYQVPVIAADNNGHQGTAVLTVVITP